MRINASLEQIAAFSNYISNFKKEIETDCLFLQAALDKFQGTIDSNTISEIKYQTKEIIRIVSDGTPVLEKLSARVTHYYYLIKRLKEIAEK